jgi:hypothetical protein
MGSLISEFSHMKVFAYIFLLSHLHNLRNSEYIREFLMFVNAIFRKIYLSEHFQFHDNIINCNFYYNLQHFRNYSLFQCSHYSRYVL